MKKCIILFLLATIVSVGFVEAKPYADKTKDELKFDVSLYGGYNFTGDTPVFGTTIGFEAFFLRADLDIGTTTINHQLCNKYFTTFGPSLGFVVGKKHKAYLMGGFQNYGYIETPDVTQCPADRFYSDGFHLKAKVGYQCTVWKQLFLGVEACHLFSSQPKGYTRFSNSNIRLGVGWKF
jgi:hypothetical protein